MAGFSYVEVLVSMVLIAIVLVPAMDALLPGIQGGGIHQTHSEDHYQLLAKIEETLAEPFASLDAAAIAAGSPTTPTSYSDVFTYPDGRQITRTIFLSRYDGDNADADDDPFTGADAGLLWLQGIIAGSSLRIETLTSVYD
jgi:type II secretory pathway pseudopilin PulG